jgi:hypothetical protein
MIFGETDHLFSRYRDHIVTHTAGPRECFPGAVGLGKIIEDRQETVFRVEDTELDVPVFEECG